MAKYVKREINLKTPVFRARTIEYQFLKALFYVFVIINFSQNGRDEITEVLFLSISKKIISSSDYYTEDSWAKSIQF